MGIDDLFDRMESDELEEQRLMSPVEYAKLRGMAPQLVYYYVRQGKLELTRCECGRRCLEKDIADAFFQAQKASKAGGQGLQTDTRSDQERSGVRDDVQGVRPSETMEQA